MRLALVLCFLSTSALAHDADKGWSYPLECCSSVDCWETAKTTEPDPVIVDVGYKLHDGTVVPFTQTRTSPDGRYHVCRRGGKLNGAVITPTGGKTCLWVPPLT